ncbi:outer membrane usher protein FimD [Pantoea agglomerans]|nr:outer membrane usher protein FimD [Pantoea agglomerans]MBD8156418.1 outer membrane usher protein FimD [Pantoea agglomerans]MBD8161185.1 outer membrane usher protein FimD [Pantoea agglomerans]WVL83518.1 outer membrane usher protein FimD [Pantoea agglomerans]
MHQLKHKVRHNPCRVFRFRYSALAVLVALTGSARAQDWFNPAFLSRDGGEVADLSRFENGTGQLPGVYRVDIWMNDEFVTTSTLRFDAVKAAQKTAPGAERVKDDGTGLTPCLTVKWLKRLGVNTASVEELKNLHDDSQCVDFTRLFPGASSYYDFSSQRLTLSFPQAAIQNSVRGYIPPEEWDEGINAGLLDYTLTGSRGNDSSNYYLNLTSGLNLGAWRLRNNGAWTYSDDTGGYRQQKWQNIATYAERTVIPLKSELVLGDSSSSGEVYDSLGFRGARIYTSDPMYPDSQQGFAPAIRGIAAGRSQVTVRQNGYLIYQNTVQSGAFEINDLSATSSSGNLEVTVKSESGAVQTFVVPYSTVPLLQREGRLKYDVVAGRYRSGLSAKGAPFFVQGTLARGFTGGVTLYGGSQVAKRYTSAVAGAGMNLGTWGAVSADVTAARSELADGSKHSGQSVRFLYAKSLNNYGTTFQLLGYRYSTRGFYTLDEAAWDAMNGYQYEWKDEGDGRGRHQEPVSYHNLRNSKKGRLQMSVSQQLSDIGALNLTATRQDYWNSTGSDTWYQAGFSSGWNGINYNLSYSLSRSNGMPGTDRLVSLNVSIPFGRWLGHNMAEHEQLNNMYATAQMSRDQDGVTQMQTGVSGTLLNGNNMNYSVMQGHSSRSGGSGSLNASWQGEAGRASGGYSYSRNEHAWNWDLSGGVVAHADGVTFSQSLGDTNVLIKAPGAKGVHVENETGVSTDWRGYAVMPYATMYRRNRVALDVKSLDMHTDLDDTVQDVVPTQGAIVRAEYRTHVGLRAMFSLNHDGHAVPFGTTVTEKRSGTTGIADDTGEVYMTGVPMKGVLEMVWGSGDRDKCQVPYTLSAGSEKLPVVQMSLNCTPSVRNK